MRSSGIHHLGIGLADAKGNVEFFDRLLTGFLGMEREVTQEAVAGWQGRGTRIYLYPTQKGAVPGALQHLAFTARSRGEVDAFPPWAVRNGITVTTAPRRFQKYGDDYYATFFEGPEGLRLELVCFEEEGGISRRVSRWKEAWESLDADKVAALYSSSASHTSGLVPQLFPEAQDATLRGVEQIREYARRALARYSALSFDVQSVTENEDCSAVEYLSCSNLDGTNPRHVVELIDWEGSRIRAVRVFHA